MAGSIRVVNEVFTGENQCDVTPIVDDRVAVGIRPRVSEPTQIAAQLGREVGPMRVGRIVQHALHHLGNLVFRSLLVGIVCNQSNYSGHGFNCL